MKKRHMLLMYVLIATTVLAGFHTNAATTQAAKTAMNKKKLTIKIGETQKLKVLHMTKGQNKSIVWKTSNKQVATVDKTGKVTGKTAGKTTITAKVQNKKYSCRVTVVKRETAADDRTNLKKIIEQQIAKGAEVPEGLSSKAYTWDKDGWLIKIDWEKKDVAGNVDFACFSQLKEISIGDNKRLTSCNTTGLTSLEHLDFWGCKIKKINISSNINLIYLNCTTNNLHALDVTKNKKLQGLACGNNSITKLNLSQNKDLKSFSCSNNPLKTLDVSRQTQLQTLYCGKCQLTALDVSSNSQLIQLYCAENQLTSLDTSKNVQLIDLFCFNNALTFLDVSKNIKLHYLDCRRNPIATLDVSTLAQGGEGSTYCYVGCDPSVVVTGKDRPPVSVSTDANNNIIVTGNQLVVVQN